MAEWNLVMIGIGIGLIVSAPVGPVNVLCTQRAFGCGFWQGLAVGAGGVLADAIFASGALFGMVALSRFVEGHSQTIQLVGGVLLLLFGWRIWRAAPATMVEGRSDRNWISGALSAFIMTLTNPGALFGFIALYSSLGDLAPEPGHFWHAVLLLIGTLAGAMLWWAIISAIVARYRHALSEVWLIRINHGAGALLMLSGLFVLGRLTAMQLLPEVFEMAWRAAQ